MTQKNSKMANKGRVLENIIEAQNAKYEASGFANIQKISTPWTVIRRGANIVSAFPSGKSTLDFRGTVCGGVSVSFDTKESEDERGLPLSHIRPHQVDYIKSALQVGELSFLICMIKPARSIYVIDGDIVAAAWDLWQKNKGRRGFNLIRVDQMRLVSELTDSGEVDYIPVALDYSGANKNERRLSDGTSD